MRRTLGAHGGGGLDGSDGAIARLIRTSARSDVENAGPVAKLLVDQARDARVGFAERRIDRGTGGIVDVTGTSIIAAG
jgi:hypothetical protein